MDSNKQPLVSVFMPTYNHEHLLAESIESVLSQDFGDYEIVIGDDASTDRTFEVASEYQRRYPDKIKLIRNPQNLGITGNCNVILSHCTGKYIAFTAGDDLFLPGKLRKQVALMESNPDCILSYHDVEVFDSDTGEVLNYAYHGKKSNKAVTGDTCSIAKLLVSGSFVLYGQPVMMKRSAQPACGYNNKIPITSDRMFWVDVCANVYGQVLYIDEVLGRYRKHERGITASSHNYDFDEYLMTTKIIQEKYTWLEKETKVYMGYLYYWQAVTNILNNNYASGRNFLYKAREYPVNWKWVGWWVYSFVRPIIKPSKRNQYI